MVQELFSEPTGLEQFVREQNAKESAPDTEPTQLLADTPSRSTELGAASLVPAVKRNDLAAETVSQSGAPQVSSQLEQALGELEDREDLQAAKLARAEASAELAEFDESVPWEQAAPDSEGAEPGESPADGSPGVRATEAEPTPAAAPAPEPVSVPASKTEQEFALILSKVSAIKQFMFNLILCTSH